MLTLFDLKLFEVLQETCRWCGRKRQFFVMGYFEWSGKPHVRPTFMNGICDECSQKIPAYIEEIRRADKQWG